MHKHRLQVPDVAQRVSFGPGHPEKDVHHAGLRFIEAQHPAQKQGAHLFHGGADRMAFFGIYIPEHRRIFLVFKGVRVCAAPGKAPVQAFAPDARLHHAAQVALDVAQENRHAHIGKAFREDFEGNGFPGAGGAGNQSVPVGHGRKKIYRRAGARADPDLVVLQHLQPSFSTIDSFFGYSTLFFLCASRLPGIFMYSFWFFSGLPVYFPSALRPAMIFAISLAARARWLISFFSVSFISA